MISAVPNRSLLSMALLVYAALLLASASLLDANTLQLLCSEGGIAEKLSLAGWLVLAAALAACATRTRGGGHFALALLSLAAAAREGDWHTRFTAENMMRWRYYVNDDIALWQRVVPGLALLVVLALAAWSVAQWLRLRRDVPRTSATRHLIAAVFGLLVLTQMLDRAPAAWARWTGMHAPASLRQHANVLEEGLEAVIPLLFLFALLQARRNERRVNDPPPEPVVDLDASGSWR